MKFGMIFIGKTQGIHHFHIDTIKNKELEVRSTYAQITCNARDFHYVHSIWA